MEADPGQVDRLVFGSESIPSSDSPHVLECVGLIPLSKMSLRRNGGAEHLRERVSRKKLSLVAVPRPSHGWDRGSVSVSRVTCLQGQVDLPSRCSMCQGQLWVGWFPPWCSYGELGG